MNKVVVFGEVLFDIIEGKEYIGGAPFNFSYYLKSLGVEVIFISAVGNDERGRKVIKIAERIGLDTSFINVIDVPTGVVDVYLENGQPSFNIRYPSAWDYIKLTSEMYEKIKESGSRYMYFGSLSLRSECSLSTFRLILSVLGETGKFCDINLRKPFYNRDILKEILEVTEILKLNEEEINEISGIFKIDGDMKLKMIRMSDKFNIPVICTTMGEKGAILFFNNNFYSAEAEKVEVVDTVGAGDAFAAGLIKGFMDNLPSAEVLSLANHLGGKAASTKGAIPYY